MWLNTSITFARIIAFYFCYLWVFPKFLKPDKIPQLAGGIALSFFIYTGFRALIEEAVFPALLGFGNYYSNTTVLYYIWDNLHFGFPYVLFGSAIAAIFHSLKQQQLNNELKEEVLKAQLSFLRAQINPHFLYNTLNYLYSLSLPVSQKLADAIIKLSELTRYTLHESSNGMVETDKEVSYISNYIDLFRMRFEPDYFVEFEAEMKGNPLVASMVLIPFVDNALKHGKVNDPSFPIKIRLLCTAKTIDFNIFNKINSSQKDEDGGIGLENVRKRLELIYRNNYTLDIENNGDEFHVRLHIQV